ncbi:hypothetical protein FM119_00660 [Mycetocola reblochoni REB411]|uniref:Uncharacterized protein n=1 Tax=Mycetocola reblochoni REB411 TaxID=1255698 RepID=A0A1R4IBU4_9MICO|nr:hypothetical protein FM119_00660 [Mycetocola reblochoni REB411]
MALNTEPGRWKAPRIIALCLGIICVGVGIVMIAPTLFG